MVVERIQSLKRDEGCAVLLGAAELDKADVGVAVLPAEALHAVLGALRLPGPSLEDRIAQSFAASSISTQLGAVGVPCFKAKLRPPRSLGGWRHSPPAA